MPVTPAEAFLRDLDSQWPSGSDRLILKVLGSVALMLQTDYVRGTRDGDVLGVDPVSGQVEKNLLALAGKGTALDQKHRVYLDVVANGIPFLPRPPLWHLATRLNKNLISFEVHVLDIVDVVVSKLKRFSQNDQDDIRAMIDRGYIEHSRLLERFRSAFDGFAGDARAIELPNYVKNLNYVEREWLDVVETEFDYPDWM